MGLKDWKKIEDDYVQRIYQSNKGEKLILGKQLTGRNPSIIIKKNGLVIDRRSFYTLKGATDFAKQYKKLH